MRRILQSLLIIAVLMCGLHIGEPAHAHEDAQQYQTTADSHEDAGNDDESARKDPANVGKTGHSHCPLTPEQDSAILTSDIVPNGAMIFTRPVVALHSLSQAPPIEPPAA